jgi:citrate lyase subunit alpha/citrate CoA-transferase
MSTNGRERVEWVVNAVGRRVPVEVNGKPARPFEGIDAPPPDGHKHGPPIRSAAYYPPNGDKRVPDLKTALQRCGLRDGMTISTHHHLRNGDQVALAALQAAGELGAKDLMWLPSASFPCHAPVIDLMEEGVVHHIEGSMNGPLGEYCSHGHMRGLGVLRGDLHPGVPEDGEQVVVGEGRPLGLEQGGRAVGVLG